jgi:hypothetical protein
MGKVRYFDGDFQFPSDFGFSGSSKGNVNPLPHPTRSQDEFGDDAYLAKQNETPQYARGGRMPKIPAPKAAKAVVKAVQIGKALGAAGAAARPPAIRPPMQAPAVPAGALNAAAPPLTATPPGMKRGGRVAKSGGDSRFDSDAEADQALAHDQYQPGTMGYAKGGKFIQSGIRRPGRMKKLAKAHGVSVHQEMERDSHSPNKSLRSAANLGLRLTGGDLKPHRKKR